MSGGAFDYNQYRIEAMADEMQMEIARHVKAINGDHAYSKETHEKMDRGVKLLCEAATYMHRIDWLISGDDGEETFHERLKEDLEKLK